MGVEVWPLSEIIGILESQKMSESSTESSSFVSAATSNIKVTAIHFNQSNGNGSGNGGKSDWSWYDGQNLPQLNAILRKYIERVQELEKGTRSQKKQKTESNKITVNIDQKEIKNLKTEYGDEITEKIRKLDKKDKQIIDLEKKITQLEAQKKALEISLSDKEKIINDLKRTIAVLNAEKAKLTGEIACIKSKLTTSDSNFENFKVVWELKLEELEKEKLELEKTVSKKTEEYINEKNKTYPLKFKLESLQRDLKYQSDLLSEELEVWKSRTQSSAQIGIEASEKEFKCKFDDRFQEQLILLRKIYEQHITDSKFEMKKIYDDKITEYEETKTSAYKAQLSSDKTRISVLTDQLEKYKKLYEETWNKYNVDVKDVKVYNNLITPEWDRTSNWSRNGSYRSSGSSGNNESGGEEMKTEEEHIKVYEESTIKKQQRKFEKKVTTQ